MTVGPADALEPRINPNARVAVTTGAVVCGRVRPMA